MVNQQQLHTRQLKTNNKPPETSYNTTCTKGKNTQAKQYCVQFLVIVMCDDTRGCVMQFWHPGDEHICSKHVET